MPVQPFTFEASNYRLVHGTPLQKWFRDWQLAQPEAKEYFEYLHKLNIDDLIKVGIVYGIEIHEDVVRLEDVRVALVLHFCSDTQAAAAADGGMMHRNLATGTLSE